MQGVKKEGIENARQFVSTQGFTDLAKTINSSYSVSEWAVKLLDLVDQMAIQSEKEIWLEKTPLHLHYIELIKKHVEAVFIHLVRAPEGNIASLMQAGQLHKAVFKQADFDKALKRWIEEFKIHREYKGQAGHLFVQFEDLLKSKTQTLTDLFAGLGIPFDSAVLDNTTQASKIINPEEAWKAKNTESISESNSQPDSQSGNLSEGPSEKVKSVLSEKQMQQITLYTKEFNLAELLA